MKKLLLMLLMCVSFTLFAQSTKISTKIAGINLSTSIPTGKMFNLDVKKPKTREELIKNSDKTSNTAQYKQQIYDVYATNKGKLFIVYPNKDKTGYTKKYIKEDQ